MRNDLRKLMVATFLVLFIILSGWTNANETKPAQFPENSLKWIENGLTEKNLLDTAYLLTFDYLEYLKSLPDSDEGFVTFNNPDVIKYFNYIYAKGILNSLNQIEKCNDQEIRKNILFKLSVQLKNRTLSKEDLRFVYENWDLDEVKPDSE